MRWNGLEAGIQLGGLVFRSSVSPHTGRDVPLLAAHGLKVDGRGCHAGVTEPTLHEVDWNAASHSMKSETVPQPFWCRMRS